jgi:hypothetical protein
MRRFLVCSAIASFIGVSCQLPSPALAQVPEKTCQIVSSESSPMFANGSLANGLQSGASTFRVQCNGATSGLLRLSLMGDNKLYNASARFRVIGVSGVFPSTGFGGYTTTPVSVSYSNASGVTAGTVSYQVEVVAPSGYLLPAASDYTVRMQAELVPQ